MHKVKEFAAVYGIGAFGYSLLEILWRGFTHWTMALTGGYCMWMIYQANLQFPKTRWWKKCALGAAIITMAEFMVGCIVNVIYRMNVWDYSKQRFNLMGQICPLYSFLWFLLCIPLYRFSNLLKHRLHRGNTRS